MFIPNEVKKKIEELEEDNKALKAENISLREGGVADSTEQNSFKTPFIVTLVLLLITILYVFYVYSYKVNSSEAIEPAYTLKSNGKVVPLSTFADSGIVFRVQIGAFEDFDLTEYEGGLDAIHVDSLNSITRISLGGFNSIDEAVAFQEDMIELGFENAYLVAYKDNQPMALLEAIKNSPIE